MRCPVHKDYWLYENMLEKEGWCIHCQKWYKLKEGENGNKHMELMG